MASTKHILRIASPVFISLVAQNIVGITDTAFMGRIGEVAMGASAVAVMAYYCVFTLGFGLGAGTQILVSRRFGEGRRDEIGRVFGQSSLLLLLAALFAFFVCFLWGDSLFHLLLKSTAVADIASEYWQWRIFGFFFAFQAATYRAFYIGIGKTKVLTYNAFIMATVNVVLDYALIFGHFGAPEMGVKGAALASVLAEASSLLFYYIYSRYSRHTEKYSLHYTSIRLNPKLIRKIFGLSFYLMLQGLISLVVWAIFFVFIEKLGERALAVAAVARSIYIFLYIPISSYSTAVNTIVGQTIGRKEEDKVTGQVLKVARLSLTTMALFVLVINLFPDVVTEIFTDDLSLVADAIPTLRVITVALLGSSVANMFFAAVSATGATKKAMQIEIPTVLIYLFIAWGLTFYLQAPVHWCFTVEIVYYIIIGISSSLFIIRGKWQHPKWRAFVE
ncbi:MAG: MATE family efflux transporter [Porphyromonas sp.]|nr:MATE family efflux transporter [Porphyromonas sp.]